MIIEKTSAIGERIKTGALATVQRGKEMSLGDWGSLASIIAVGLWMWDHRKLKKARRKAQ